MSSSHSWGNWRGWKKGKGTGRWGRSLHCPLPVFIFRPLFLVLLLSPAQASIVFSLACSIRGASGFSSSLPHSSPFVRCVFLDMEVPSGPCHSSALATACFPAHLPQSLPDSLSDTMPFICKSTVIPKAGLGADRLLINSLWGWGCSSPWAFVRLLHRSSHLCSPCPAWPQFRGPPPTHLLQFHWSKCITCYPSTAYLHIADVTMLWNRVTVDVFAFARKCRFQKARTSVFSSPYKKDWHTITAQLIFVG